MTPPADLAAVLPVGETVAFCLRLRPGCAEEYRRRHVEIFLEPASLLLFAYQVRRRDHTVDDLSRQAVWQRWQNHMADLLVQHEGRAERIALESMFRLGAQDAPAPRSAP
jgi:L-rhamnose mutarotase